MKALLLFFFSPLQVLAQDITGIWTGYLQTTEMQLPYELVISEDKDRFTGFSLTVFTFNGVENMGIKSMKLKNKNGKVSMEDDELIYNNFSSPSRKVKLLAQLSLHTKDSVWILSGRFFTRSLDFRAGQADLFSGTIYLKRRTHYQPSILIAKLDELDLLTSLSFAVPLPEKKEEPGGAIFPVNATALPKQGERTQQVSIQPRPVTRVSPTVGQQGLKEGPLLSAGYIARSGSMPGPKSLERNIPKAGIKLPGRNIQALTGIRRENVTGAPAPPAGLVSSIDPSPARVAAAQLAVRRTEVIRTVPFSSDSLVLSLYDNGTIDGDTVSVVLNGKVILPKKGLTANAIRTTIQITPEMGDALELIMYAENLGSIPPNTGLLIIQDGEVRNEIRFAGDMQKSSAIILKRKR